jgi:hypothetical protein
LRIFQREELSVLVLDRILIEGEMQRPDWWEPVMFGLGLDV